MFPEIADCSYFLSVNVYFGSDRIQSDHARHVVSRVPHELDLIGTYVRNQWQSLTGKEPIPLALNEFNMWQDRKSTRLNSSHVAISYAVFCLKKKNNTTAQRSPVV